MILEARAPRGCAEMQRVSKALVQGLDEVCGPLWRYWTSIVEASLSRNAAIHCHGASVVWHAQALSEISTTRLTQFIDCPWDESFGSFSEDLAEGLTELSTFLTSKSTELDKVNRNDTASRAASHVNRHAIVEKHVAKLWPDAPPPTFPPPPRKSTGSRGKNLANGQA